MHSSILPTTNNMVRTTNTLSFYWGQVVKRAVKTTKNLLVLREPDIGALKQVRLSHFAGRRIHHGTEKAKRRLAIKKKVQKFLGEFKGDKRQMWGQLVATLIMWFPLVGLQINMG